MIRNGRPMFSATLRPLMVPLMLTVFSVKDSMNCSDNPVSAKLCGSTGQKLSSESRLPSSEGSNDCVSVARAVMWFLTIVVDLRAIHSRNGEGCRSKVACRIGIQKRLLFVQWAINRGLHFKRSFPWTHTMPSVFAGRHLQHPGDSDKRFFVRLATPCLQPCLPLTTPPLNDFDAAPA